MTEPGGYDPGSFRDRAARVLLQEDEVYRVLDEKAYRDWERLRSTDFFQELTATGEIVGTVEQDPAGSPLSHLFEDERGSAWSGLLKHERIPFVSYPYEWSFGMLRDAALLQLRLQLAALGEGMSLKDASAFNVLWRGCRPVFIDVPSFEEYDPGTPWVGYHQFVAMCLNPLFLQAYKGVPFQPWLRGSIEGIEPQELRSLCSLRDLLRPGVLKHVYLHARAQASFGEEEGDLGKALQSAGFGTEMVIKNVEGLVRVIEKLSWEPEGSTWSDYQERRDHYDGSAAERKDDFVRAVAGEGRWGSVWDLGCNVGRFSRLLAGRADYVVAMDADHVTVERLYRELRSDGPDNIHPLVVDLSDPSPNLGWRGMERRALVDRRSPDLVLCLALVHHLVIGANIPLDELVGWLAELGADLVIEFVGRDDPMVQKLLRNKPDIFTDYDVEHFESLLSGAFEVVRRESLAGGTRNLYFGRRRR